MKVEISFLFCADCFDDKLEGIRLRTTDNQKLISYLKDSIYQKNNSLTIKQLLLKDIVEDSVVCVYTNKIKYYEHFRVIGCRRVKTDPCWK